MRNKIPDVLIERLHLGELEPERRAMLLSEPETAERLRELEESDRAILERYRPDEMAAAISRRLAALESEPTASERVPGEVAPAARTRREPVVVRGAFRRFVARRGALPLLAAALVVLAIGGVPLILSRTGAPATEQVRVKGILPSLEIFRQRGSGAEQLHDGSLVAPGDLLQIAYVAGGASYGTIFSIDGSGTVTLHFPENPGVPPRLNQSGEVLLPFSYELDRAPSFERFVFVTSAAPFSVSQVLSEVRQSVETRGASGLPTLPSSFTLSVITLRKGG